MCNSTTTNNTTNDSEERHVSFGVAPEIITVERLQLSFYHASDFQRFRDEQEQVPFQVVDDHYDDKYGQSTQLSPQRASLVEKRQRGYQLLSARRTQRLQQGNSTSSMSLPVGLPLTD